MKDDELPFDRSCHVLYSKPCKKEIQSKIALHYPEAERAEIGAFHMWKFAGFDDKGDFLLYNKDGEV